MYLGNFRKPYVLITWLAYSQWGLTALDRVIMVEHIKDTSCCHSFEIHKLVQ